MRIAILPLYSFHNILGDVEYLKFRSFIDDILETYGDESFFYFFVPKEARNKVKHERKIRYLFQDRVQVFYDSHADYPATLLQLLNPRVSKYQVDCLFTSRTAVGYYIQRMLWDHRLYQVPVLIEETMAQDISTEGSTMIVNQNEIFCRTSTYAHCHTLFDSNEELDIALTAAKRHYRPHILKKIENNAHIIPNGLRCDEIDEAIKGIKKYDKFTGFFGGRFNATKRIKKLIEIYINFFRGGRNVQLILVSPKMEPFTLMRTRKHKEIELHTQVRRKEFWRYAAKSHVMVNTSAYEGFSLAILEMLYIGLIAILPRMDWVKRLLKDRFDDYPFLYDEGDFEMAETQLRKVYKGYSEAKKSVSWIPRFIRDNYDSKRLSSEIYDLIKEIADEQFQVGTRVIGKENQRLLHLVKGSIGKREVTLDEVYDLLKNVSVAYRENEKLNSKRGKMSLWLIKHWFLRNGFIDLCDGPYTVLKRGKSEFHDRNSDQILTDFRGKI